MTGFGRGTAPLGEGQITLEIKTVNHRFLEVRSRSPRELLAAEVLVEKLVRRVLNRGHCTVFIGYEGSEGGAFRINRGALVTYMNDLKDTAQDTRLPLTTMGHVLAGAPDIYALPSFGDADGLEEAVTTAFEEASTTLIAMRGAEGLVMADDIAEKLGGIGRRISQIAALADTYSNEILERTRKRIKTLLEGMDQVLDPDRLEAEAAILADKADINEEIKRLESHCAQMRHLLRSPGPVGRRMEFLVQEMGREINTIGSKSAVTEITHLVVELKTELEKVRELVANVE